MLQVIMYPLTIDAVQCGCRLENALNGQYEYFHVCFSFWFVLACFITEQIGLWDNRAVFICISLSSNVGIGYT